MNELLNLHLPEIGPYSISGKFSLIPEGYRLDGLELQVGSSSLAGNVLLDTKAVPPAVAIDLEARTLQLDDFKEIWLGTGDAGGGEKKEQEPEKRDSSKEQHHFLTDQTVLDSYDAAVSLAVKEVYSGEDYLGSGLLRIEQKQGSVRLSPLYLQFPKGIVDVEFSIEPADHDRRYLLDVTVDDLDYGFVGRWFKPDSEMAGSFSLHTLLESESPDFRSILANGSGSINFLLQPERLTWLLIFMGTGLKGGSGRGPNGRNFSAWLPLFKSAGHSLIWMWEWPLAEASAHWYIWLPNLLPYRFSGLCWGSCPRMEQQIV